MKAPIPGAFLQPAKNEERTKMDLKKDYGTDRDLVKEGVWVPFDDCSILIAYANDANTNYEKAIARYTGPHQKKIQSNKAMRRAENRKVINEAIVAAYADSVVLGWKNLQLGGKDLEYSKATCKEILLDFPEFFAEIREFALEFSNFQSEDSQESEEISEKNL